MVIGFPRVTEKEIRQSRQWGAFNLSVIPLTEIRESPVIRRAKRTGDWKMKEDRERVQILNTRNKSKYMTKDVMISNALSERDQVLNKSVLFQPLRHPVLFSPASLADCVIGSPSAILNPPLRQSKIYSVL